MHLFVRLKIRFLSLFIAEIKPAHIGVQRTFNHHGRQAVAIPTVYIRQA
jgi:hypothetical protein